MLPDFKFKCDKSSMHFCPWHKNIHIFVVSNFLAQLWRDYVIFWVNKPEHTSMSWGPIYLSFSFLLGGLLFSILNISLSVNPKVSLFDPLQIKPGGATCVEKIQNKWFENTTEKLSTSFEVFEFVFVGSRMAKMITSVSGLVFMTETLKKPCKALA